MARGVLVATQSKRAGTVMTAEANGDVANGHVVPNSGLTKVLVRNSDVTNPYAVTVQVRMTVGGQAVVQAPVTIPATQTWVFGPYPRDIYGDDLYIDVANAALKLQVIEG